MKNILLLATAFLFAQVSVAQDIKEREVPSVVVNALKKTFPKATGIDWEKKNGLYEAEFDLNWRDNEVWLDNAGNIVRHKKEIAAKELPAVVKAKIQADYPAHRIDDVDQYQLKNQTYYKVELKNKNQETKVVYDKLGKVSNVRL